MTIPLRANVAHVVAKLVARRTTPVDELPALMRDVQTALERLAAPLPEPEPAPEPVAPRPVRMARPRPAVVPPTEEPVEPPPPPRLLRRADVVAALPPEAVARPVAAGVLRGVVKWFDQRLRRGALRLPGRSDDVPVEPALLDELGLSRLYKGQEIEATLSAEATPRLIGLAIPGGAWQVHQRAGVVHNRHAKPVVVELKREAIRRAAARAEAEIVLGPSRRG